MVIPASSLYNLSIPRLSSCLGEGVNGIEEGPMVVQSKQRGGYYAIRCFAVDDSVVCVGRDNDRYFFYDFNRHVVDREGVG